MIEMSQRWQNTIIDTSRSRHMLARVDISLGEAFADKKTTVISPTMALQSHSKPAQLNDTVLVPSYNYAGLDGTWTLGDGKRIASDTHLQTGLRGTVISGSGGTFTSAQRVTQMFNTLQAIESVDVAFDSLKGEYAVDFQIIFRNNSKNAIRTWTITGNTQPILKLEAGTGGRVAATGVRYLELSITKWSHAGRIAKITECFGSKFDTFTNEDRIISLNVTEQDDAVNAIDPGGVYSSKLTLVLDDSDKYFRDTEPYRSTSFQNKLITVQIGQQYEDGEQEFCLVGTFFVDELNRDTKALTVTIIAQDILKEFDNRTYKKTAALKYPATLASIFEDVVVASDMTVGYVIDDALNAHTIPTEPKWDENISCRQVFKYLAQAAAGNIKQMRGGGLHYVARITADRNAILDPLAPIYFTLDTDKYLSMLDTTAAKSGANVACVTAKNNGEACATFYDGSIPEIGLQKYEIKNNPIYHTLLPTGDLPVAAARNILKSNAYFHKTKVLYWIGDPALEAGDSLLIYSPEQDINYARSSLSEITYNGSLRMTTTFRSYESGKISSEMIANILNGSLSIYTSTRYWQASDFNLDENGLLHIDHTGVLEGASFAIGVDGILRMTT